MQRRPLSAVIAFILVIIVGAVAAYLMYFKREAAVTSSSISVPGIERARAELTQDSVLASLRDDTVIFIRFDFSNFSPLKNLLLSFKDQVFATNVAKKFGIVGSWSEIEEKFVQGFYEGFLKKMREEGYENLEPYLKPASEFISTIDEITLILSNSRARVANGAELPMTFLEVKVADDKFGAKMVALVDQILARYDADLKKEKISIEKTTDQAVRYVLSATHRKDKDLKISASLKVEESRFRATFLTDDEEVFMPSDKSRQLINSPLSPAIEGSYSADSSIFLFFSGSGFFELLKVIEKSAPKKEVDEFEKVFSNIFQSSFADIGIVTYGVRLFNSVASKQCIQTKAAGTLDRAYAKIIDHDSTAARDKSDLFIKHIKPNTLLAGGFSGGSVRAFLDTMYSHYKQIKVPESAEDSDQQISTALEKLALVGEKLEEFSKNHHLKEFGFTIESSESTPIPEFILYISSYKADAAQMLNALTDLINSVAREINSDGTGDGPARLSKNEHGQSILEVVPYDGLSVRAAPAGINAIQVTFHGPFLAGKSTLTDQGNSYIQAFSAFSSKLAESSTPWATYSYINTEAIISAVRAYLPFLLMNQQEDAPLRLELADLEEILRLFSTRLLTTQSVYRLDEGVYCFHSDLVALQ